MTVRSWRLECAVLGVVIIGILAVAWLSTSPLHATSAPQYQIAVVYSGTYQQGTLYPTKAACEDALRATASQYCGVPRWCAAVQPPHPE